MIPRRLIFRTLEKKKNESRVTNWLSSLPSPSLPLLSPAEREKEALTVVRQFVIVPCESHIHPHENAHNTIQAFLALTRRRNFISRRKIKWKKRNEGSYNGDTYMRHAHGCIHTHVHIHTSTHTNAYECAADAHAETLIVALSARIL